jgi:hypothetical protein
MLVFVETLVFSPASFYFMPFVVGQKTSNGKKKALAPIRVAR